MLSTSDPRRIVRALPLAAALALALVVPSVAAAVTGPTVAFQLNDVGGRVDWGTFTLATAADPPIAGPDISYWGGSCGLPAGQYPADSVGALLEHRSPNWDATVDSFPMTLTVESITHNMGSVDYGDPATPAWHLWINDQYFNLSYDYAGPLCAHLHTGDRVVLQASELLLATPSAPYATPVTPQLRIATPATVVAGAPFTATVSQLAPAAWDVNGSATGASSVSAGYGVGVDDGISTPALTAVDAQGHATLTAPNVGGYVNLVAAAGTDVTALPHDHRSAFSMLTPVCVYNNAPGSPCTATLSGAATDFGTQARGTIGAATPVVVTPAHGTAAITGAKIVGGDVDDFMLTSDGCSGTTVDSGVVSPGCSVRVRFAPSLTGARTATLRITSDATNTTLDVPLTGTGGSVAAGTPGPDGERGAKGDAGAIGATGATGATGASGPQGATGPQGKAGKNGRDAVCTVKRAKGAPKVTCKLTSSASRTAKATLTRLGKVYASGTVASLRATRRVPAGAYTLRYHRSGGAAVAVRVHVG